MFKTKKRTLFLGVIVILALLMVACGTQHPDAPLQEDEKPDVQLHELILTDGMILGESDGLRLIYESGQLQVEEIERGNKWPTTVTEKQYEGHLNELWRTTAASLVIVNYTKSAQSAQIHSTNPALSGAIEKYYRLSNGLKIKYDFTDLKLKLALELIIDDDHLVARLPAADIIEYGENRLISIEIMPFLGSASEEEDGYFVYPDGSGALFEFSRLASKQNVSRQYKWQIYGSETAHLERNPFAMSPTGQFFLPVYGIKKGTAGLSAIISQGDEDAGINLYTSAMAIRLNRICPEFIFRYTYDITVNTLRQGGTQTQTEITSIEDHALLYDREVRYLFLEGDASYSEMASAVREYYRDKGVLREVPESAEMPLGIDFLVGIRKNNLLSEYISMTSFEQCAEILNTLKEQNIPSLQVTLEGWEKGGYGRFPAKYKADRRAGGLKELSQLAEQAQKLDVSLFLNVNFVDAFKDIGNFSNRRDLVRNPRNIIIKNRASDRYLLRPSSAAKRLDKMLKSIPKGISGLSFEGMGSMLFSDYSRSNPLSRRETAQAWVKMFVSASDALGGVSVYGGNLTLLSVAGRLNDIPYEHSGFTIADRSIPFFQMVVHGSIAYSAQPINLFHDERAQTLKQIEYGYIPYYKWTQKSSSNLNNTQYNTLFSSYYKDYIERAVEVYERFHSLIGDCWTASMLSHDMVADEVYRVQYSNGVVLFFNYTNETVSVEDITIPPMDVARKLTS